MGKLRELIPNNSWDFIAKDARKAKTYSELLGEVMNQLTDPKTGMLVPPQGWRQLTLSNPDTKSYGNNQFRRRSAGIHSFGAVRRRQFSIVSPAPLCTRRFNDTGRAEFPTGGSAYAYTCDRHRPTQELVYTLGEQQNAGQPLSYIDLLFTVVAQDKVTVNYHLLRVERMANDCDLRPNDGLTIIARGVRYPVTPLVQKSISEYTASIEIDAGSFRVVAIPNDYRATIRINGHIVNGAHSLEDVTEVMTFSKLHYYQHIFEGHQ